ncbi:hypothetical protein KAT36_00030 [Candidatus Pacearchaeota archaeon]|nr:hypothetical protein [Candidatus Pacearchaeota archaeon]
MMIDGLMEVISPIMLSVLLIIYLMAIELGSPKVKRLLIPVIIVLMVIFAIVFIQNIAYKL